MTKAVEPNGLVLAVMKGLGVKVINQGPISIIKMIIKVTGAAGITMMMITTAEAGINMKIMKIAKALAIATIMITNVEATAVTGIVLIKTAEVVITTKVIKTVKVVPVAINSIVVEAITARKTVSRLPVGIIRTTSLKLGVPFNKTEILRGFLVVNLHGGARGQI
jgi:hypothetical protein